MQNAKPGELFWFITTGKVNGGMPSWPNLPKAQRWQIVTFLQSRRHQECGKIGQVAVRNMRGGLGSAPAGIIDESLGALKGHG